MDTYDGLLWLLLVLGPLLILQRALHREIQAAFLIMTRQPEIAVALFSLLFLPGVLLHEGSHYVMAKILNVPTGRVSLIPESIRGNRLRLGFVETGKTDILRDALIGTAPLLIGGLFVAYAGILRLNLLSVWDGFASGNIEATLDGLASSFMIPDFWIWFYLAVAVSSTMFPSQSDRRAWLPVTVLIALILGLAMLFGAGPWMSKNLLPALNDVMRGMALVFAISAGLHLVVLFPALLLRRMLSRVTGYQIIG